MRPFLPFWLYVLLAVFVACAAITPERRAEALPEAASASAAAVRGAPDAQLSAPVVLPESAPPAVASVRVAVARTARAVPFAAPAAQQLEEVEPGGYCAAPAATVPDGAPDPEADALGYGLAVYQAVRGRQWSLFVSLLVVGLVAGARRFGVRWVPWFGSKWGGIALAIAGGVAGTVALALGTGGAWSASLIVDGLINGLIAAGLYDSRKLVPQRKRPSYVPPTGPRISPLSAS